MIVVTVVERVNAGSTGLAPSADLATLQQDADQLVMYVVCSHQIE